LGTKQAAPSRSASSGGFKPEQTMTLGIRGSPSAEEELEAET
jgi:hypothetical protein